MWPVQAQMKRLVRFSSLPGEFFFSVSSYETTYKLGEAFDAAIHSER